MSIDSLCDLANDLNTSIRRFNLIEHNKKIEFEEKHLDEEIRKFKKQKEK